MTLWLVAVAGLILPFPGWAFTSCAYTSVPGNPGPVTSLFTPQCQTGHYDITFGGAAGLGFSWAALTRVADANVGVDTRETHFIPKFGSLFPSPFLFPDSVNYDPTHHFDHPPSYPLIQDGDKQAFMKARDYVLQQVGIVITKLGSGKCDQTGDALDALGRALHATQDLYSHSNYVDLAYAPALEGLSLADQQMVDAAVLDFSLQPPTLLRLTLYGFAADPENPTNTCKQDNPAIYCHEFWAKDSPGKNLISGKLSKDYSVYIAASQAAQNATGMLIRKIITAVGQNAWDNLVGKYGTSSCQQGSLQTPCSQQYAACNPKGVTGQIVTSNDPNDKVGPQGSGGGRFTSGNQSMSYAIYFDNQPTASAPAQTVSVTDMLNANLVDLSTLTLGPISFVDKLATPPSVPLTSLGSYSTDVDLRPGANLLVRITVTLNTKTGVLKWTFTSLDPVTSLPTTDPLAGFLPPGQEGSVMFTVAAKAASTGAQVTNKATIVFDVNPPIDTPVWLNTIDNTPPTSRVTALAATQTSPNFPVLWGGSDVGSGVQDFTIYVSDNGSTFTAWQTNTSATSTAYSGQAGHTYSFYSIARDLVGNIEPTKSAAESATTVQVGPTLPSGSVSPSSGTGSSQPFTFTYTDAAGFQDISGSQIVINSTPTAAHSCYILFGRGNNVLALADDSGTPGPLTTISSPTVLQNSQCSVLASVSSQNGSGNTLMLTVYVVFKPGFIGPKNVYTGFSTNAGVNSGLQQVGTFNATASTQPLTAVSVSPASGAGQAQAFTFNYFDPNGYPDISGSQVLFNTSATGVAGCYILFGRGTNQIALADDTATAFPVAPLGAQTTLQNSQCTVFPGSSFQSGSGTNLSLTLFVAFKPAFAGTKNIYSAIQSNGGVSSTFPILGTWTVPASAPALSVVSVSPAAPTGPSQALTFTFADPNGFADISGAQVVVNPTLTASNSCYIQFSRGSGQIFLTGDDGVSTTSAILGQPTVLQNSQCIVNAAASSQFGAGNDLSLTLFVTMKTPGVKNVYAGVGSNGGATAPLAQVTTWNVTSPAVLTPVSINPGTAAGPAGTPQFFTFTYSDPAGASDISGSQIVLNSSLQGSGSCYVLYARGNGLVALASNDANSFTSGTLGSATVLQNNQCSVDLSKSFQVQTGNTVNLTLAVNFAGAYRQLLYGFSNVQNNAGMVTSFPALSTFTVQ